jgi:hypothetical protein
MNKSLLKSRLKYPEILLFWGNGSSETELRLHDKTLAEAYNIAIEFGYRPPVWYKPWQYLTGGMGVITIGFGVES